MRQSRTLHTLTFGPISGVHFNTSTALAPWYVVPADHKWFARVVIISAIVNALEKLDLQFPKVDKAERSEFKQVREALLAEGKGGVKKATVKKAK